MYVGVLIVTLQPLKIVGIAHLSTIVVDFILSRANEEENIKAAASTTPNVTILKKAYMGEPYQQLAIRFGIIGGHLTIELFLYYITVKLTFASAYLTVELCT